MSVIVVAILLAVNVEVSLAVTRLTQPRLLKDSNLPVNISLVQLLVLVSDDTQSLLQEEAPQVRFLHIFVFIVIAQLFGG